MLLCGVVIHRSSFTICALPSNLIDSDSFSLLLTNFTSPVQAFLPEQTIRTWSCRTNDIKHVAPAPHSSPSMRCVGLRSAAGTRAALTHGALRKCQQRSLRAIARSSSASMQEQVVICGGGIIGVATAYYLTLHGVRPLLVEKRSVACAASGMSPATLFVSSKANCHSVTDLRKIFDMLRLATVFA